MDVLHQNKMADATLSSSSDDERVIEDPIQVAIDKGACLSEPERAYISRKRKVIVNS